MENADKIALERARQWLDGGYDQPTKDRVREMMRDDLRELTESFYRTLEFGTGGLRGIMGVGTNRMNTYTVGMATQGLANYLKKCFPGREIRVAVAHDCRNNSDTFARTVAEIFAANGFTAYLFDALRPTPELSFAIRQLGCQSGVVVTASHNPKEYNGYKAYWEDGGQVTEPHDAGIIEEVNRIQSLGMGAVCFSGDTNANAMGGRVVMIGEQMDGLYLGMIKELALSPEAVQKMGGGVRIVYTPIHGTGVCLVPRALAQAGFTDVVHVPEQDVVSGDFPTVVSPNPEEASALKMALDAADRVGAELVMATDPDADRIGIAVRDDAAEAGAGDACGGGMRLLNGNQTGSLLTYYLLERWRELGRLHPGGHTEFIVKTIVTTELMAEMAREYGVDCEEVLTGFKFIAAAIRANQSRKTFIGGGEESYGFMIGDRVRDKDAVSSAVMIAECAAWARGVKGLSLFGLLKEIYVKYGFFKEAGVSVVRQGREGLQDIARMMHRFRSSPPRRLGGGMVVEVRDYLEQYKLVGDGGDKWDGWERRGMDHLPKSDVLQFVTEDQSVISVRPSGTEPKIKFYIGVRGSLPDVGMYDRVEAQLADKIARIKGDLGL